MNLDALYSELTLKTKAKLALVVLDGLGDIATQEQNYLTPLEAATTPNLDKLCKDSAQGRMIPVAPGITPGSGPGHLGLFGYDPLEFQVGRGVIEALGLGMELKPGDVGRPRQFLPRSTPRASSPTAAPAASRPKRARNFARMLSAKVKKLGDTEIIIKAGKEHRFVVVFRGKGLEGPLTDADPNREGFAIPTVHPRDENNAGQKKMAALIADFYKAALPIIAKEKPANGFLMRGIAHQPHIPLFEERYKLKPAVPGGLSDVQGPGATRRHEKNRRPGDHRGTIRALPQGIRQLRFLLHPLQIHRQGGRGRQFRGQDEGDRGFRRRAADSAEEKTGRAGHHRRPFDARAPSKAIRGIRNRCCCIRRSAARTSSNASPKPARTSARSACSRRNISSASCRPTRGCSTSLEREVDLRSDRVDGSNVLRRRCA